MFAFGRCVFGVRGRRTAVGWYSFSFIFRGGDVWFGLCTMVPCAATSKNTIAAVAQLSVPVLAVGAGVVFLAEPLTLRWLVAGLLVLGGIAVANIRSVSARRK